MTSNGSGPGTTAPPGHDVATGALPDPAMDTQPVPRAAAPGGPSGRPRPPFLRTRRIALLALVLVVGAAGLGAVASVFFPVQYAARAELLYPISVEQPTGFLREDRELTTQVLLLGSRAVLEPVAVERGLDVTDLQDRTTVEIVESSEIIGVEVRAPSREEGTALVGAVVERYLAIADGQRADPARAYVQAELDRTRGELADSPEDENLLERERALVAQLDTLTTDELARPEPTVVVAPYPVPDPVGVGMGTTTAVGALLGILAAAAWVLVAARLRQRTSGSSDDEHAGR